MKQVAVSILGTGELLDRKIAPGTTAGDLLRDINLPNGLLSKTAEGDFFAQAEPIYDKVGDGAKLFASTPASVGAGLLGLLKDHYTGLLERTSAQPSIQSGGLRRPIRIVQRRQLPYWRERGWTKTRNTYLGKFVTPYGAYAGWIAEKSPIEYDFYIQHPPACILKSSHAACFRPRGNHEWYSIHMSSRPRDISSGIVTVERLIADCFRSQG